MAGLINFENESEVKEFLDNLGVEYSFQCYREKDPEGKWNSVVIQYTRVAVPWQGCWNLMWDRQKNQNDTLLSSFFCFFLFTNFHFFKDVRD